MSLEGEEGLMRRVGSVVLKGGSEGRGVGPLSFSTPSCESKVVFSVVVVGSLNASCCYPVGLSSSSFS